MCVKDSSRLTCDMCGTSLKHRDILLEHIKKHLLRLEGLQFPCLECGKTFPLKKGLREHKRNVHGPAAHPQKCPKCGRMLKNANSLQLHTRVYHNPKFKRRESVCMICGKKFLMELYLNAHLRKVHKL